MCVCSSRQIKREAPLMYVRSDSLLEPESLVVYYYKYYINYIIYYINFSLYLTGGCFHFWEIHNIKDPTGLRGMGRANRPPDTTQDL